MYRKNSNLLKILDYYQIINMNQYNLIINNENNVFLKLIY